MRGDKRPIISQITPMIYLANAGAASSESILSGAVIGRIVSVTDNPANRPSPEFCAKLGIEQKIFPIQDMRFDAPNSLLTETLFPWVKDSEKRMIPTIIQCHASVSRSPAFIMTYLVWNGMALDAAILRVIASHPIAAPRQDVMESFLLCINKEFEEKYAFYFRLRRAQAWFKRLI